MTLKPVEYSLEDKEFIQSKINSDSFSHTSWSDDDLSLIKDTIKRHYHELQKSVCPYCKQKLNSTHGRHWDIEHIIPRVSAPKFMFEAYNLCMACVDCNAEKSAKLVTNSKAKLKYPISSEQYLIIHPHFDDYNEHLLVVEAGLFYYPLKPKGRKTIEVCGLNRFYEFAGFGSEENVFEKIHKLTSLSYSAENEDVKKSILKEIAALALNGIVNINK